MNLIGLTSSVNRLIDSRSSNSQSRHASITRPWNKSKGSIMMPCACINYDKWAPGHGTDSNFPSTAPIILCIKNFVIECMDHTLMKALEIYKAKQLNTDMPLTYHGNLTTVGWKLHAKCKGFAIQLIISFVSILLFFSAIILTLDEANKHFKSLLKLKTILWCYDK